MVKRNFFYNFTKLVQFLSQRIRILLDPLEPCRDIKFHWQDSLQLDSKPLIQFSAAPEKKNEISKPIQQTNESCFRWIYSLGEFEPEVQ